MMKTVRQYTVGILLVLLVLVMALLSPVMLLVRPRELIKAYDQVANVAWFRGDAHETISAHAGRILWNRSLAAPLWAHLVALITNLVEDDHVSKAAHLK